MKLYLIRANINAIYFLIKKRNGTIEDNGKGEAQIRKNERERVGENVRMFCVYVMQESDNNNWESDVSET